MAAGANPHAVRNYKQTYAYDKVGNILSLSHDAGDGSYTRTFNYRSGTSRLAGTSVVRTATTPYSYDKRGNMLTMPHLSAMDWNSQNQLSHIKAGTTDAYYQYSGGQRIRKMTLNGIIKEERIYLGNFELYRKYVSGVLTLERTTVHISDDTGRIAMLEVKTEDREGDESPALLKRFIYSNQLQSSSFELDGDGKIISYEEYHPYGTTSYQAKDSTVKAAAKRYRFTGKERDEESGLNYHGARYYAPWLCRWTAVDPLESKYAGWSPYNYCTCNPINHTDSTGEGNDDLKQSQHYKNGVIPYDYAEWKGWDLPANSGAYSRGESKMGDYTITPYYHAENGKITGNPLFYTASIQLDIMEGSSENGGRNIIHNGVRTDYVIMPWGLDNFKKNAGNYELASSMMHFQGWGTFEGDHLNLSTLKALDGNLLGAVGEQWKGALKDPTFYLGAALTVGELGQGRIRSNTPNLVKSKFNEASTGNLPAAAELRVAEQYRRGGANVVLQDANAGHAQKTGTFDMTVNGVNVDVKRISGLGRTAAGDVAKGVNQVGSGGMVVIVRPANSKFTPQQYQRFINNFNPSLPNVKVIMMNENSLPNLNKIRTQ